MANNKADTEVLLNKEVVVEGTGRALRRIGTHVQALPRLRGILNLKDGSGLSTGTEVATSMLGNCSRPS